jgi:hypothetical protein
MIVKSKMDQELKQYLDSKFAEFATRKDLDAKLAEFATRKDLDAKLAEFATRRELQALEERMKALIEKTETNLLGAFYGWARPMEVRVQGISTMVLGFDERLALAEQRISELERKRAS